MPGSAITTSTPSAKGLTSLFVHAADRDQQSIWFIVINTGLSAGGMPECKS
jgi:hypothetical protein